MIKLVPKTETVESAEITHPAQSGTSNVIYTVTHNMGRDPDAIFMSVKYISLGSERWRVLYDFEGQHPSSAVYQGYTMRFDSSSENHTGIGVYKVGSNDTEKIKFKLVWY